ncbi:MAG: hypothetical protein IV093_00575 [Rubrivivax sp.]|nr:hypothetical protein [Rubrivivax sp.]
MKHTPDAISRRQFVGATVATLGGMGLSACGGGGAAAVDDAGQVAGPAPQNPESPTPPPPPPPAVLNLKLHSASTGVLPFAATLFPLRGVVPAGKTLVITSVPELDASVLSRWPDGSAAVVVLAGSTSVAAGQQQSLGLALSDTPVSVAALTVADVSRVVKSVHANFGADGVCQIADFSAPDVVWWANSQTLCARYRAPASIHPALELVIDVQVYRGGRALVEIVCENAKLDLTGAGAVAAPVAARYADVVVEVNGTAITTVSAVGANHGPDQQSVNRYRQVGTLLVEPGEHRAFRAWYASTWLGGDPLLLAHQDTTELQSHPLLYKFARQSTNDLSVYENDVYVPWAAGRHRSTRMGDTGLHPSIGPLTAWDIEWLRTGDPRLARASQANTLAVLTFNVSFRDKATGFVPTFAAIGARSSDKNWPKSNADAPNANVCAWEVAHHPAQGLVAFLTRPSPVFIEIAQKINCFNGTWSESDNPGWGNKANNPAVAPFPWTSGIFGHWYQIRGRGWCFRSLAHACFLTPATVQPGHRADQQAALAKNVEAWHLFKDEPTNTLNVTWRWSHNSLDDYNKTAVGVQFGLWQHHYVIPEICKVAKASLLDSAAQARLDELADWIALQPVRWVNEQPNGSWRYVGYQTLIATEAVIQTSPVNRLLLTQLSHWGAMRAWQHTDAPPTVSGSWVSTESGIETLYSQYPQTNPGVDSYTAIYYLALVHAVERGVPGASQAWNTVQTQITNLQSWIDKSSAEPRWVAVPRV